MRGGNYAYKLTVSYATHEGQRTARRRSPGLFFIFVRKRNSSIMMPREGHGESSCHEM